MIVTAPAGDFIGTLDGVMRRFRGIPYAEAPVGQLRFAPPVRRGRFTTPFLADREGATPQIVPLFPVTTVPEPSIPGDDVLTLSIVTPAEPAHPLPVLVWIHGGAFVAGSPASPWYDGRSFARDGVIVVTIAYRLGVEGFSVLPGVEDNLGLRDQIAALQWVQENIAAFGGDPSLVTIAGQSAGGGSVIALLASPQAEGLFAHAVCISGGDFAAVPEAIEPMMRRLADQVGTAASRVGFEHIDVALLQQAIVDLRDEGGDQLTLQPTIHGEILPEEITTLLATNGRSVPLLIGATGDEFDGSTSPENGDSRMNERERAAARAAGTRVTDTLFRAAVPRIARAREGIATWAYTFEWATPVFGGATHCIDVPFFFDVLDAEGASAALGAEPPASLATEMHRDLVTFITTGKAPWPTFAGELGDTVRQYGADPALTAGSYDPVLPRHSAASPVRINE